MTPVLAALHWSRVTAFLIFNFFKAFIELVCVAAYVNHRLLRPDCQSADIRAARDSAVPTLCCTDTDVVLFFLFFLLLFFGILFVQFK